ncbi:DNA gyrase subunit A [Acidithiobacillus caldus]|uniref:DNA gyrase subunit A n=2 Tax=Acidithiobacillus caldus TaxID=33059 RepID=F9ZN26_ACICS|nr:DNA gyrase subunit A [Acidithiobacillus caldus]AEK58035.1 DNA gyrase subunit A [Acidithiobacillus caldus SM-1]AUW32693.1 DNA gyrase subunit A [Acidithiobacillus caldus]MBU2763160.1 DNA gyrase subunit A [Acidithiobacillus caldus]MBU2770178.1 DNA gyrase subunit A [Acidithiobacillus caldus]QER45434.1 DNA gyrase, subunit A, type II topoisomerase [Acidithiobacillus caldus]
MVDFAKETIPVSLEKEMRQSYLDYAMSVIVGRALPDARDGLKPVHRRVLYAMHEMGNDWNKPYKKSARVVGDVIGKYHPHGDVAVYDTIVRMAQDFSMRYPLIDGQGNFGSVDGDSPAAMRYTEVRMARIAHEMLADIERETVDFGPNYDEKEVEPQVLPARIPNLLINGSAGIAVGMATNIPPHNLTEILNACIALVDDDDLPDSELFRLVPAPDFPTAGILLGNEGAIEAYRSGRGRVVMRARAEIETDAKSGRQTIAVSELPYQVNKAKLIERIAEMVKEKRLDGVSDLRDESDKSGMRIAIELKRDANAEVVLNNLYQHTALQSVFNINMVALLDGAPQTLGLRDALKAFLRHRREVVTRRSIFDLKKARDRAHILEGLAVALVNLDPLIALIRAAASPAEAKAQMLARVWEPGLVAALLAERGEPSAGLQADGYHLSEAQAQAILDLRLHRLTGLEQDKIREEYLGLLERIRELLEILGSDARLMAVIRAELVAIRDQYGDARRSEIVADTGVIANEDLIAEENMVVTFTHAGYIKAQPVTTFNAQRRGGRGKVATTTKEEDFVERMFCASTHATVLFFSNLGKVFWQKVYQLPQSGRSARGKPIVNLLSLAPSEGITTVLPVREFQEGQYVCMVTAHGVVKKTPLMEYSRPRSQGINAINLDPGDRLVAVCLSDGQREFMLFTRKGMAVRFPEDKVRPMGRTARGVRGISLDADDRVISAQIVDPDQVILTATAKGYGKLTNVEEYRRTNRGGKGVIAIQTNARNGQVVGALAVKESDELMLVSNGGTLIRIAVQGIRRTGRNAQGVRLIQLAPDEQLAGLALIADAQEEAGQCDFELEGE